MTATFGANQAWGAHTIPNSRVVLQELPFWVVLSLGAYLPATLSPPQNLFGVPVGLSDLLLLASGFLYGFLWLANFLRSGRQTLPNGFVLATLALFGYGALRTLSGSLEQQDQSAMLLTLCLAACAPLQACGLLSGYNPAETKQFANRLTLFLAITCAIYTAESVFNLGLRSEEGRALGTDFGIQRVRGPLFGPSTGYFLLLPALGWSLASVVSKQRKNLWSLLLPGSLLAALLGLGSRAALILVAALVLLLAFRTRQLKKKLLALSLFVVSLSFSAFVIYGQADTQRLQSFEDSYRRSTHETVWTILSSQGALESALGAGYGTIWNWYLRDVYKGDRIAVGDNLVSTPFGISLYHSHSTVLELLAEFGLPGLVWLLSLAFLLRQLANSSTDFAWRVFAFSLLVSVGSFAFDLFIFKSPRVNTVWWLYLVCALQLAKSTPWMSRRPL
ncbi:MAG: O-antigen ligase family protein [Bryobacter sp.]|nr:O-antigen ligase family protein [Bryobacter sp.]